MSKRVPTGRFRGGKGRTGKCAVAGAENIDRAESVPDRADEMNLPAKADWFVPGHARRAGQQRRRRRADDEWSVQIDLPEAIRINVAELAALEAYLGNEIDAILAIPSRARTSGYPCAAPPLAPGFEEPL